MIPFLLQPLFFAHFFRSFVVSMQRLRKVVFAVCARGVVVSACRPKGCLHALQRQSKELSFTRFEGTYSLQEQRRFQSSGTDKKFHCSVCKKGFRLEMAAKVHIQQAHGGSGTVESGVGPGQSAEDVPPVARAPSPPMTPTKVAAPLQEEKRAKKQRPPPKPLHQPDRHIPDHSMAEMLKVWDDVGVKRLGGKFVHSSMIMKVYAADPGSGNDKLYEDIVMGVSPFHAPCVDSSLPFSYQALHEASRPSPYVVASREFSGPLYCAENASPFGQARVSPMIATKENVDESSSSTTTPPITPFGQLPVFGTVIEQSVTDVHSDSELSKGAKVEPSQAVASPFSGMTDSPFARAVSTPSASHPFLMNDEASSTTSEAPDEASPFMNFAAASPFASADHPDEAPTHSSIATSSASVSTLAIDERAESDVFKCSHCERTFASHSSLRMHSKAKHKVSLPPEKTHSKKSTDLPAYIPSPVNLTVTSPFVSASSRQSWPDVELHVFTQSVNNMIVVGTVAEVTKAQGGEYQLGVLLARENAAETEKLTVRCSGGPSAVAETLVEGDEVFVCGSLHLTPIYEPTNKKCYSLPMLHVTSPGGTVAKV